MNLLLKLLAALAPCEQILFEGQGLYSDLQVTKRGNRVNLFTGHRFLQSSFDPQEAPQGTVFDWYLAAPWFSGNFRGQVGGVLILGLGAGAVVKLYNRAYQVKGITGVEIDPVIIDLGRKYFNLNDDNLQIVNGEAGAYLKKDTQKYDLILVDAFKENIFEVSLESASFLQEAKAHLADEGLLLVNRVAGLSNQDLEQKLKQVFKTVAALKVHHNIFYMATNAPGVPKSAKEACKVLFEASESNSSLSFFRSLKITNLRILQRL